MNRGHSASTVKDKRAAPIKDSALNPIETILSVIDGRTSSTALRALLSDDLGFEKRDKYDIVYASNCNESIFI